MKTLIQRGILLALIGAIAFIVPENARAQASDKILSANAGPGFEGQALTISADLARTAQVSQVLVAFRPFGTNEYRQVEASITGNTASAVVRGSDVVAPALEYFIIVRMQGKDSIETFTYPAENPESRPLRVDVQGAGGGDKTILFLSPEPGGSSTQEELLISVALSGLDSTMNMKATKIIIDEQDVTEYAFIAADLITLVPENIKPALPDGPHVVRIELYGKDGSIAHKASLSFSQTALANMAQARSAMQYNVSAQIEARNETIHDVATPYNRGSMNISSEVGPVQVNGKLYVTNEDKERVQPQNRYYLEAKTSWLKAAVGDAYPVFPSLIMSGKRVRGVTADLNLGFFNFDVANGEIVRSVEGIPLAIIPLNELRDSTSSNPGAAYGPYDTTGPNKTWARYSYGQFSRKVTAFRPSFGKGENFQLGFSYLKSNDDAGSIQYGIKPQENVAVGSDLLVAFDNKNILFTAQAGASAYNTDISKGSIADSSIDVLKPFHTFASADSVAGRADSDKVRDDRRKFRDLRDMVKQFITVNDNLVPLNADKLASIMAGEGAFSLNYFGNYLKAGYVFRGPQYNSFGQNFLRKDVQGLNLFDRVRLAKDQVFVSGGYEHLSDNLDQSKVATTDYTTWNTVVSYFPRFNFPNLTVGYSDNTNSNGLSGFSANDSIVVNDTTVVNPDANKGRQAIEETNTRYFMQAGYDFTAMYRHNVSLGFSNATRDDRTYQAANTKNTTVSLTLTTTWTSPLQTTLGYSLNMNQIPTFTGIGQKAALRDYNYTSLQFGARYRLLDERLRLSGLISPTFGDFSRTVFDANAEYLLVRNVWLVGEFSILQTPGISSDGIWSMILRYNM